MFTGIIEEVGKVELLTRTSDSYKIKIQANTVLENTKIGDSIAVNGLCLTVSALQNNSFSADIMPVTVEKSSFRSLQTGTKVNLERALQPQSRMGGHIVTGHIDGIGAIVDIAAEQNAVLLTLQLPDDLAEKVIPEGSIAVEGISLTIARISGSFCTVSLIPHTFSQTNLQTKAIGEQVNLESDVIGKYVYHFLQRQKNKVDMNFLQDNGFF